jgi:hypothetical protein
MNFRFSLDMCFSSPNSLEFGEGVAKRRVGQREQAAQELTQMDSFGGTGVTVIYEF